MGAHHEVAKPAGGTSEADCDLLVVGAGPAGLAGATFAARHGLRTLLVDERPTLGGQIHRQPGPGFVVHNARRLGRDYTRGIELVSRARAAGVELVSSTPVLSLRGTSVVLQDGAGGKTRQLSARRILLAPGAHDRPVAFPGWTLPGVLTAGGAQALVKSSRVVPGNRVVFAGSGPLALAFPAQLRHYGINIVLTLEAGAAPNLQVMLELLRAAPRNLGLLAAGLRYRSQLLRAGVPMRYRRIILRAEGDERVEAIVHGAVDSQWRLVPGSEERLEVDTICIGYGFVASVELFRLAGCRFSYDEDLGGPVVEVDDWGRTSVPGILAAGDGTGVRGALVAADQGRLAGLAAALDLGALAASRAEQLASGLRHRLEAKERFRQAMSVMYRVGPGIFEIANEDTIVCRCEEVTLARIEEAAEASANMNVVKSYTRAGMGLCQGKNCQLQVAAVLARRHHLQPAEMELATARPPVRPVPIGVLADPTIPDQGFFVL